MSIFESLKNKAFGQFIDVIDWVDASRNTLTWKFPRSDNEIKNGAQLIVRESQAAVFLHEGELGDVFGPGRYELTTGNIPILTSLKSWKYAFNSPFKADVYFVNTRQFVDQKWGTANPIMMRDAEFGPLRLRAFGNYSFKVTNPGLFIKELSGTAPELVSDEVSGQLRNILVSRFADALGEAKIPALDLAAQYNEMGELLRGIIQKDFADYGIEISKFLIENISLPPAVEEALDKRTQMGVLGDMNKYTQFQAANALGDAAKNPGAAGSMVGMFAGMNLGQTIVGNVQGANAQATPAAAPAPPPAGPPPLPETKAWYAGIGGKQEGPFNADALKAKVASGEITGGTLVWAQGMANWIKAGEVPELSGILASAPPPLPPA
ncbi:MAG: SPFH domain-containing protein [Planctomycetota bacterium]|jgi:membrane protease subunit (stomatin/prohibitin family)|nr:SPFH domain-containing protein [Planctomycetota bacterium]